MKWFSVFAIGVMLVLGAALPMQASFDAFLQIEGIDGEVSLKGLDGTIEILDFNWGIVSPRDPASGQATGKRAHKPLRVRKAIDAVSAELAGLVVSGKHIPKATIIVRRSTDQGGSETVLTIELENILISSIHHGDSDSDGDGLDRVGINVTEDITFVYSKITWRGLDGKEWMDDWSTAQ